VSREAHRHALTEATLTALTWSWWLRQSLATDVPTSSSIDNVLALFN